MGFTKPFLTFGILNEIEQHNYMNVKKGVLVMAYGAPNKPADIEPFYTDIRRGRKPTPELLQELTDRYALIGGSSPLLGITTKQATALEKALDGKAKVYVGMRHWEPWIREAMADMKAEGITEVVALVMAPHYSKMSIGKYMEIVRSTQEADPEMNFKIHEIKNWHTHPLFIEAVSDNIREAFREFDTETKEEVMLILSAHSLPERILTWGDPYPQQLLETSRLVAEKLDHKNWMFAYQSEGRTPEPWLGPDICKVMEELHEKGVTKVLSCPIGFIADHLEVIYDIDIEAGEIAKKNGTQLVRARMLNDNPKLIKAFVDIVEQAFKA